MEEKRIDMRMLDESIAKDGIRSRDYCWKINQTNPNDREKIVQLEKELLHGHLGEGSILHPPVFFNLSDNIRIGNKVSIMNGFQCMAAGGLIIEDNVRISLNCVIATNDHDMYDRDILICKPVHIKENAWLGVNVTVLPGVTIGKNAVIGAGSVVNRDIPDNAVAVGIPAKVKKYLDPDKFKDSFLS